jgi:maleate cis-trans isomerase
MSNDTDPLLEEPNDPHKAAAEELASKILDIMKYQGRSLKIIEGAGFSENIRNRFVRNVRQMYTYMMLEVPGMYRADLDEEIQQIIADESD